MIFTVSQAQIPIHLIQHHVTLDTNTTDTGPIIITDLSSFVAQICAKDPSVMSRDMTAGYRQTLHYYNTQIMVIELTVCKACSCYFEVCPSSKL